MISREQRAITRGFLDHETASIMREHGATFVTYGSELYRDGLIDGAVSIVSIIGCMKAIELIMNGGKRDKLVNNAKKTMKKTMKKIKN